MRNWSANDWTKIRTVDAHAAGEPLRVVTDGVGPIPGGTILEKRRFAREHLEGLRRTLMFEPRGHADMYGALATDPVTEDGDLGVLFMHNEGWSTMCGHGIIALVTVALETKMLQRREIVKLDTPAGRVTARATLEGDRVRKVAFENVPSFSYALDQTVEVPDIGMLRYDIAFGGAFYAFVQANDLRVELIPRDFRTLIHRGMAVKRAVMKSHPIRHPYEDDLSFLYGTIIVGPPHSTDAHSRNVCIFAEGEVDRSPTGTGVSARLALEYARGQLKRNEPFIVESIIDTRFTGTVVESTKFGQYDAIIPRVEGSAWITGKHEFLVAPDDPIKEGFILR
ncbi:MAG: proline racemase family protein [Candidatus Bathyarchaeia archaeon]